VGSAAAPGLSQPVEHQAGANTLHDCAGVGKWADPCELGCSGVRRDGVRELGTVWSSLGARLRVATSNTYWSSKCGMEVRDGRGGEVRDDKV